MSTLQPEFCESNYADLKVNTKFSIALTPAANWYQDDKKYLYDHFSDKRLYTSGADSDSTTVTIEVDFTDDIFVDTIKLLNCNFKEYTIEVKPDGGAYTTVKSATDNTESRIQYYDDIGISDYTYLQAEDGSILTTEAGVKIEPDYGTAITRSVKVTATKTFTPNQEKYIGELYIGKRALKVSNGRILDYKENNRDFKKQISADYNGVGTVVRGKNVYNTTMRFSKLNLEETLFLKDIVENGGLYDFFPTGSDYGTDLDNSLSINDIHYVTTQGSWNPHPWRASSIDTPEIQLLETKYVA